MPPRYGKSELVSRLLPAYYLDRWPDRAVGLASYGHDLAGDLSAVARNNYAMVHSMPHGQRRSIRRWETGRGGEMWASGVGGGITGRGYDLGIIDDPVKDATEALSETHRRRLRDWYETVWETRITPRLIRKRESPACPSRIMTSPTGRV